LILLKFKIYILTTNKIENFHITGNTIISEQLLITSGHFDFMFISNDQITDLIISGGLVTETLELSNKIKISNNLMFTNTRFDKLLSIKGGIFQKIALGKGVITQFQMLDGIIKQSLNFTNTVLKNVSLEGGEVNQVEFSSSEISQLQIKKSANSLKLSTIIFRKSIDSIHVSNVDIANITFEDFNLLDNHEIKIDNLNSNSLNITKFNNYGVISFNNLNLNKRSHNQNISECNFKNCDLGSMNLVSSSFEISNMTIDNSKLIELFYTNTTFPESIQSSYKKKKRRFEQQQDTYGQLEIVSKKSGQNVDSMKWRALSNNAHLNSLFF
jgi:uncharacterized protein YjbI with pentapeptide repeats